LKILALDASEQACSVALLNEGDLQQRLTIAPRQHAALLLPMAQELLAESELTLAMLDAIAVARGPGAFTGLRIATSAAQGLALGADLGIAPISTLHAMVARACEERGVKAVIAALDARMEEVYIGGYRQTAPDEYERFLEEQVCTPAEVRCSEDSAAWPAIELGVGSGWIYQAPLQNALSMELPVVIDWPCHAKEVARLAQSWVTQSRLLPPEEVVPAYLRNTVAQTK